VTPAGAGAASVIVITVPVPRHSPAAAGNEPGSGAGKTGAENILAGPDREQIRERVPASGLSHGAGPKNDPSPGSGAAGPVPENADTAGAGPDQGTAVADHMEKPYVPDMSQYPGMNLELVRRFTRWRKEQRKKGTVTG